MLNKHYSGKLFVIEGTDGSGKGTQSRLLAENLKKKGYKIKLFDFPRYGERSASLVEDYLNGKLGTIGKFKPHVPAIFYAADRFAASQEMYTYLKKGYILISNRYTTSSFAHLAGQFDDDKDRAECIEWIENLEYEIFEIPKPNHVFFLKLDPSESQKRIDKKQARNYLKGKKRDIHEDDTQHLSNALRAYIFVAKKYKWETIEATKSIEEIQDILLNKILGLNKSQK